jgi:hypothetical protein
MREARELQTQIEHLERHIAHLDKQLQDVKLAKPEQRPVAWLHPDKKVDVVVPTSLAWFDKPIALYALDKVTK